MNLTCLSRCLLVPTLALFMASAEAQTGALTDTHHAASVFQPTPVRTVFRAQSGGVPLPADAGGAAAAGPVAPTPAGSGAIAQTAPQAGTTWNAFSPQISSDPFATGPGMQPYTPYAPGFGAPGFGGAPFGGAPFGGAPYGAPNRGLQPLSAAGTNGPAPFRYGWSNRLELEYMPGVSVALGRGNFHQFGVNYDLAYGTAFMPGWMLTWTNEFALRQWKGPVLGRGLPGGAYHFGWDFALETAQPGPINIKLGITPSLNTDFGAGPNSDAFLLDGRGMMIFKVNPRWDVVLGAGFWDRVNDRVVPYAGVVYRDEVWEMRLLYPESTLSLFLGNDALFSRWLYCRVEHHVEAYEVDIPGAANGNALAELEDWRAVGGFRMDGGTYTWFIEAGWIFGREVDVAAPGAADFDPDTGFIARMGWRY